MARKNVTNEYDEDLLRDRLLALRPLGWKVKLIYNTDFNNENNTLFRFRANKGHVNLRGAWGSHYIGDWETGTAVSGWLFKIFIRNENGGYTLNHKIQDLEEAITKASGAVTQEAPAIPTWDRKDLPEPFPLPDRVGYRFVRGHTSTYDTACNQTKIECVKFECLTMVISSLGIVSISPDCKVSMDAASVPGNRAWFLLSCQGTTGKQFLVTDGEYFYPVSKRKKKYKISLTLEGKRNGLANLKYRDSDRIRAAIGVFANTIAEQHS